MGCGFNDVISLDKTDEHFRMLYDAKGRFVLHRLNNNKFADENSFKLCRVNRLQLVPRVCHTSPLTMAGPFVTQTPLSRSTTPSRSICPLARSLITSTLRPVPLWW